MAALSFIAGCNNSPANDAEFVPTVLQQTQAVPAGPSIPATKGRREKGLRTLRSAEYVVKNNEWPIDQKEQLHHLRIRGGDQAQVVLELTRQVQQMEDELAAMRGESPKLTPKDK